jgi:hypothetical protein
MPDRSSDASRHAGVAWGRVRQTVEHGAVLHAMDCGGEGSVISGTDAIFSNVLVYRNSHLRGRRARSCIPRHRFLPGSRHPNRIRGTDYALSGA